MVTATQTTKPLKLFSCTHDGKFIFGISVVVASSKMSAKKMLIKELTAKKISSDEIYLEEIDLTNPAVYVLFDGVY